MHIERPLNRRDCNVIIIFRVVIPFLIIIVVLMSNIIAYPQDEVQAKKNDSSSDKKDLLTELPQEGKQISFSSPFSGIKVLFKQVKNDTIGNWIINGKIK